MSMQGNFNYNLMQTAQVVALAKINKSLQQIGCNSIDELDSKICDIEIQIAALQDQGIDPTSLKELLKKYKNIKEEYNKAVEEKREKDKKTSVIGWTIFGIFAFIGLMIMLAELGSM